MGDSLPIREGQILTGVLFSEPMRVETVRANGPNALIAGLVGTKSERFRSSNGIRVIDLGAGHSSSTETLCGRVISALKSQALLNESVGAGYIDRNWPPALMESGAWPLTSLRQSFLNGALTRMIDPDGVLRNKIVEFVGKGEFGLASGQKNGAFDRVWFEELIAPDEVVFEPGVFLLRKSKAEALKAKAREDTSSRSPMALPPEGGSEDETNSGGKLNLVAARVLDLKRVPFVWLGQFLPSFGIDWGRN